MPKSSNIPASHHVLGTNAPWNLPGAQNAFDVGISALRAGFLAPARNIFRALAPQEPSHPELLLALAETELSFGDPVTAQAILDDLPSGISELPQVQVLKADCAMRRGRIAPALMMAFACSELDPADSRSRFLSARLLWLGGQESEAEMIFLSLAGDPDGGARACAWAVLCGWRQNQLEEVHELLTNLRRDDVVCEGLREFGFRSLGIPWEPNQLVEPSLRRSCAEEWEALHMREVFSPGPLASDSLGARLG